MKRRFSVMTLITAIALTTIIPMFFSCFEQTQITQGDSLQLGFPFIYYNITAIAIGSSNIKYAVHFQLGTFFADVVIAYFVVTIITAIVRKIKACSEVKK